jgi:hypothetical protein
MAVIDGSRDEERDGERMNCGFCKGGAVGKKVKRQHWLRCVLYDEITGQTVGGGGFTALLRGRRQDFILTER